MRTDKPIGSLLLLWPTYWALWLASEGMPNWLHLVVFSIGVFVMRSAGCVINDYADRKVDGHVERTKMRPLASGKVTSAEAIQLFILLIVSAFLVVLLLSWQTVLLSFGGLVLAFCYPFMKRYTHLPQVVLGAAFSWAIPMAYMAVLGHIPSEAWILYIANLCWTMAYDTMYGMVDRDDDVKIGIKSTAILFGQFDKFIVGLLQLTTLVLLGFIAFEQKLSNLFYISLICSASLFIYQQYLIKDRVPALCFKAFLNNHNVGLFIFIGIAIAL
ncbi:4-hydroxybenzoate polyprenyltransferase [Pseudoalteromonas denitrificans DSM 6059]|uniref:4-hydroxybenzoate octaprenyltransferase n=2 Tax=Pseudoalteromonas TaxID=53246 RepID=A0A1I1DVB5_9GAMM|nr:4-hydroxybenzoate polyprenyltransferase [Pseudoalteromonas denitrificans DSM 6059]